MLQKPVFALPGCQRMSVNTLLCDTLGLAEISCGHFPWKLTEGHHARGTTLREALRGNLPLRGLCGGLSEGSVFPWKLKDENLQNVSPKFRCIFRLSLEKNSPELRSGELLAQRKTGPLPLSEQAAQCLRALAPWWSSKFFMYEIATPSLCCLMQPADG